MVDPKYYLEVISNGGSFQSVYESSFLWASDFIFIFFSWLSVAVKSRVLIPFTILLLFSSVIYRRLLINTELRLFVLLGLFLSSSSLGLVFNIWRQGLALALLVFLLEYGAASLRWFLTFAHVSSLLPINVLMTAVRKMKLGHVIFMGLVLSILLRVVSSKLGDYTSGLFLAYGDQHASIFTFMRVPVYVSLVWLIQPLNIDIKSILYAVLLLMISLVLIFPGAIERFAVYIHILIGLELLNTHRKTSWKSIYREKLAILIYSFIGIFSMVNSKIFYYIWSLLF